MSLVAYLTPKVAGSAHSSLTHQLRSFLGSRLPSHMIPSHFEILKQMPETPNGKIDRNQLAARNDATPRSRNDYVAPRNSQEKKLATIWSDILGIDEVGARDNFFELGGDSILSVQVAARAAEQGLHITTKQIFEQQTVAGLSSVISTTQAVKTEQGVVTGSAPLTPIQQWFFSGQRNNPNYFNQTVLLGVAANVQVPLLADAFRHLVFHHDALRMRFSQRGDEWHQTCQQETPFELERLTLAGFDSEVRQQKILKASKDLQEDLCLTRGPIIRAMLFSWENQARLLIAIHHLVVDGISWRILLEDLERIYHDLKRQKRPNLPAKTSSYLEWARVVHVPPTVPSSGPDYSGLRLDYDFDPAENTPANARTVSRCLPRETTKQLLKQAGAAYRTRIDELLLTTLLLAIKDLSDGSELRLDLEGHGREHNHVTLDITRTVGWFTTIHGLRLSLSAENNPGELIKKIKEQVRQHLAGPDTLSNSTSTSGSPLVLNYLGQADQLLSSSQLFLPAYESLSNMADPHDPRTHLLEINGLVTDGRLRLNWTFCDKAHCRQTINDLADRFMAELTNLIDHCLSPGAGGRSPSDFPLAEIDQQQIDALWQQAPGFEDLFPLSPMQSGILYHGFPNTSPNQYLNQFMCRFRGHLDGPTFQKAWYQAMDRHDVLRTTIHWEALDQPLQMIHPESVLDWRMEDWSEMTDREQDAGFNALCLSERQKGFDLGRLPLMRFVLIHLRKNTAEEAGVYRFLWSFPHLLLDGWSTSSLIKEVFAVYGAFLRKEPFQENAPPSYRNYIAWLQDQDMVAAERFWRTKLNGFETSTPLVMEHHKTVGVTVRHHETRRRIAAHTIAAMHRFTREHRLTPNTLFRGIWSLLLHRYSNFEDIVFGATVARPGTPVGWGRTYVRAVYQHSTGEGCPQW